MKYIEVRISKPLYGNFCYIREKYIDQAIKENKLLKVLVPDGYGIHSPSKWKNTGKRMSKVFKLKDCPMILWGNEVKIMKKDELTEEQVNEAFQGSGYLNKFNEPKKDTTSALDKLRLHLIRKEIISHDQK